MSEKVQVKDEEKSLLGLFVPNLVTPLELLSMEDI